MNKSNVIYHLKSQCVILGYVSNMTADAHSRHLISEPTEEEFIPPLDTPMSHPVFLIPRSLADSGIDYRIEEELENGFAAFIDDE